MWIYGAAAIRADDPDTYLLVPGLAGIKEPIASGYPSVAVTDDMQQDVTIPLNVKVAGGEETRSYAGGPGSPVESITLTKTVLCAYARVAWRELSPDQPGEWELLHHQD